MAEIKKKFSLTFWGITMILSIIAGAFSGIIAAVAINQSLDNYVESLSEGIGLVSISQVKPEPLPGTYEESLERVQTNGWRSLVIITAASTDRATSRDWITVQKTQGTGIVVTSDGWILTDQTSLSAFRDPKVEAEVWVHQKRYAITKVIEDDLSDLVMIKVEANDLPALAFGATQEFKGGEISFVMPGADQIVSTSLLSAGERKENVVLPAEVYSTFWLLDEAVDGPVLNSNGELIGFARAGKVMPLHQAVSFIQSVLRTSEVSHAAIGAYVSDLSAVLNIDPTLSQNQKVGALIVNTGKNKGLVVKGPAQNAGLLAGDIIISVDGTALSTTQELAEIISTYSVGQTANFKILRAGSEQTLPLTFANYADLVY